MEANVVTLLRVALVFVAVGLLQVPHPPVVAAAVVLVAFVLYLDALDGYVARRLKIASDTGALFDILGDRIVEQVLWIYFAVAGMVSLWVPLVVVARGLVTDNVRTVAFKSGHTAFGEKTMMRSPATRFLVASRFSRGLYGGMKAALFVYLALLLFLSRAAAVYGWGVGQGALRALEYAGAGLAYTTVALCLVRGLPVLWDGRQILFEKGFPRRLEA
ncbi:MAG: CDP-alcohol phosphatidyltransferase family protein [Candidatus Latescibacterota bacterium]